MRRVILRRFAASATPRERRFPQSLLPAFFAQTTQQTRLAKALAAEEELLITSTTKARVDRLAPEIVIPQIPHPVKISTVAVDPPRVETASPIVVAHGFGQGSKRVIQRRFNVNVPRARVSETAPTLRERSER